MSNSTQAAIVTGGGRGIGAAIACALARGGRPVAVVARTGRELGRVVDAIEREGGRALALPGDLTVPAELERVTAECETRLGPIGVLVNNAGVAESAPLARTDDALWDRHLLTNLTSTFWMCRALGPRMAGRGFGRIVNVSSVAANRPVPYTAAYSASKAGLVGLGAALSAELGPQGVTVNTVCPGWVNTSLTAQTVDRIAARTDRGSEGARADILARAGQTRFIEPEEVAALVAFLTSAEASAINGQAYILDGVSVAPARPLFPQT